MLSEEISTDVLVIGGGLAGLLTAWELNQRGVDVVLVEKDRICAATTAHTTAKITAQHGLCYHKLIRSLGTEGAGLYYQANAEAADRLKALCRRFGTPMEEKTNYVYSSSRQKLGAEVDAFQKLGIGAIFDETPPLPLSTAGAVGIPGQAQFHPLKLAEHLVKDLPVYEHSRVTELIRTTAKTEHGRIRAEKIVIATHFPFLNKHGSYFLKLYQHRSYLLALENAGKPDAMYVDDDQKGMSFSSFDGHLLLGGGGHRTGKKGGGWQERRPFANSHYPNAKELSHWAAQDTMSLDGIPYIGQYSRHTPDLYVAAGFNKWGMTGSMVSAGLLADLILGQQNAFAELFSPSRSILKPQLVLNCAETTANFLLPTTRRCPHLGCALKYNREEHSWDCACHGSRFSESGKVLDNPANGDMK
jgi:glycine/D-amino acid oxidase-like deaminating enzyme